MADASTAAEPKSGGSAFGFLGKKVFGKIPVWVIAVGAIGAYYWYTRYGPGKSSSSSTATSQTDPAGNVGTIDPSTGYVYGSPEDVASLASAGNTDQSGGGADSGSGGGGGGTGTVTTPPPGQGSGGGSGTTGRNVAPHKPPGVGKIGEGTRPPGPVVRKPPTKVTPRASGGGVRTVTVQKGQTLAEIAKANHISVADLAHANKYVAGEASPNEVGKTLGTGAGLKTGQVLTIPK